MFKSADINFIHGDLGSKPILVVGDVMLDCYWFGDVKRISPEAPVPIAKIEQIDNRPGGAANVARNIASLGGKVSLLSVVGEDEHASTLKNILQTEKIDFICHSDPSIKTILKLRVVSKNQQLIRLDFEEKPSHEVLAQVLQTYKNIIHNYSLVILSDYGKGGLKHITEMIEIAKQHHKPILIDPKGNDYAKYKNATLLTPNKKELQEAVGAFENEQELQAKALKLKTKLNLKHLLVTRSQEGITLFSDQVYNYPTLAQEVYDVSGAGDTVIATLGLMLANGASIQEATKLANLSAGIVVAKLGTATVTKLELLNQINQLKE